jgi:hypothetical protein
MRYAFRLAELLGHTPDRRKRPGTIKAIVEHTGLDRHQVAALLKNEAKYIPLEALSKLCDYLIDHGHATADQLPGALFAIQPESFWELLARRRSVEICVGVRQGEGAETPENAWVVASDSVLVGELLSGVTTVGGVAKHRARRPGQSSDGPIDDAPPQPERLQQTLTWSPGQVSIADTQLRAREVFESFTEDQGDKALVCVGSVKSNPVVEMIFADAFGCEPFTSEDDVELPGDRTCPFFLRYREHDPQPGAASAGMQLSRQEKTKDPGFYYEQDDGTWTWAGGGQGYDTALVFYIFREPLGRLEMVLSGFSGRATRLLAKTLASRSEEFWPPVYREASLSIGAFIVQYDTDTETRSVDELLQTDVSAAAKIFPISGEAIRRRMERR